MTTPQELITLAERVERATGPDRELDRDICLARRNGRWIIQTAVPAYTASLDAAMTLVPEGWDWSLSQSAGFRAVASLWQSGKVPGAKAVAATPALALTAACLRAHAANLERIPVLVAKSRAHDEAALEALKEKPE